MTGNEYKKLIGRYVVSAYGSRGLKVYDEVSLGTSIIGKQRRIDLFVIGPDDVGLAVECKYQDSSGTADEKIPYALNDMAAQRVAGVLVYAGNGFSEGVRHLLQGSEQAAYCLPDEQDLTPKPRKGGAMNSGTWQLDHALAQTFKLWDIIVGDKQPMRLDAPPPAVATGAVLIPAGGMDRPTLPAPANTAGKRALKRPAAPAKSKAARKQPAASATAVNTDAKSAELDAGIDKPEAQSEADPIAKPKSPPKTKKGPELSATPPKPTAVARPPAAPKSPNPESDRDLARDEPLLQLVNLAPPPNISANVAVGAEAGSAASSNAETSSRKARAPRKPNTKKK